MNPFYFGSGERRLFGIYTPALTNGVNTRAIVLCHPWGQEYLRAHRSMRQLATMLTAEGVHVLRFDYYGTGDSAGDMANADLRGWESDIETAIDELKDTTGASQVSLAGLRLGAPLAAAVAKRRNDVDALVLWDPVVIGTGYLTELWEAPPPFPLKPGQVAVRAAEVGGGREIAGFALTDAMAREIEAVNLPALAAAFPKRTLIVVSESLASHDLLQAALSRRPDACIIENIPGPRAWVEDLYLGAGAVPVKLLQRVQNWLTQ